ncbi:MAG: hypothetical protein PHR81_02580 [Bacteroidales bacterium]|jgi:hypothetical protein|nr:hypothetical protein [Bacteroidales bacterium]MDD4213674.1 hypothetical protein [Bacteroidales bacterium]
MKKDSTKKSVFSIYALCFFTLLPLFAFSQQSDTCDFLINKTAIFYGVDFSKAKLKNINNYGFPDVEKMKAYSFNHINYLLMEDSTFTDLKYIFLKNNVYYRFETVKKRNIEANSEELIKQETNLLSPITIDSIISFYPFDSVLSEYGILLIVQNLVSHIGANDVDVSYSNLILTVFQTSNHKIILAIPIKGLCDPRVKDAFEKIVFEDYWFKTIKHGLFTKNFKKLKKRSCNK